LDKRKVVGVVMAISLPPVQKGKRGIMEDLYLQKVFSD
jgi:hypothetical protein